VKGSRLHYHHTRRGYRFDLARLRVVSIVGDPTKVLVSKGFRVFGCVRKQADADRLQKEFGDGFVPLIMDITDATLYIKLPRRSAP
jgi:hypothetical protein